MGSKKKAPKRPTKGFKWAEGQPIFEWDCPNCKSVQHDDLYEVETESKETAKGTTFITKCRNCKQQVKVVW